MEIYKRKVLKIDPNTTNLKSRAAILLLQHNFGSYFQHELIDILNANYNVPSELVGLYNYLISSIDFSVALFIQLDGLGDYVTASMDDDVYYYLIKKVDEFIDDDRVQLIRDQDVEADDNVVVTVDTDTDDEIIKRVNDIDYDYHQVIKLDKKQRLLKNFNKKLNHCLSNFKPTMLNIDNLNKSNFIYKPSHNDRKILSDVKAFPYLLFITNKNKYSHLSAVSTGSILKKFNLEPKLSQLKVANRCVSNYPGLKLNQHLSLNSRIHDPKNFKILMEY